MGNKGQYSNLVKLPTEITSATTSPVLAVDRRNTGGIVADTGVGGDSKPADFANTILPNGMKKSDWILVGGIGIIAAIGLLILFRKRS